jgi:hypothetical protein
MSLLVVGFIGSIIYTLTNRPRSFTRGFITVLAGTLSANYLTPLIMQLMSISMDAQYGVAFFLGYSGLKIFEIVLDKFKK